MARQKLSRPDQPFPIRAILRLYEFLASLKLAVVMILSFAFVLMWATFIESHLGTSAGQWYVYHTRWFAGMLALLGVNIFCAASIRYPWKRHQTGFVVTHTGLLVLLFGSWVGYQGSLNSQMLVFLNDSSQFAVDNDEGFLVFGNLPGRPEPLRHDFRPGPFNWDDRKPFDRIRRLKSWVGLDDPSQSWKHPPELVYDHEGTKIEIVDFYSRSEMRQLPFLDLQFNQPAMGFERDVALEYREYQGNIASVGFAKADFFEGVGHVLMWRSDSEQARKMFQKCIPPRPVDGDGAVVILVDDEVHQVPVARLEALKEKGESLELKEGVNVELVNYKERLVTPPIQETLDLFPWMYVEQTDGLIAMGPNVDLLVRRTVDGREETSRVVRFANYPFYAGGKMLWDDMQVDFYHPDMEGRIDILEGPGQSLAYRVWQQKLGRVVASGDLNPGEMVDTWSMGGEDQTWKMTLRRYVPREGGKPVTRKFSVPIFKPEEKERDFGELQVQWQSRPVSLPFEKDDRGQSKRVKVRISWDDTSTNERKTDEFWLGQSLPQPWAPPDSGEVHETDVGAGQPIKTSYHVKETEVGFALKLIDFDLDVDPGTRTAANYTSHVVQIDVRNEPEVRDLRARVERERDREKKQALREDLSATSKRLIDERLRQLRGASERERKDLVASDDALATHVITMNEPLDYPDLRGRTLRFFQENYLPPDEARNQPLGSIFRVNRNPGRAIQYFGSALITLGIFLMFYMRAYFFKGIGKRSGPSGPSQTTGNQPSQPARAGARA